MLTGGKVALGQIEPYARNPWYWQYDGKPILLVGGSDRDNIFQWAGQGARLTDHLDLMANCGGNYVRFPMTSREYTTERHRWDLLPYPFAKVNGKYDLMQWDETCWGFSDTTPWYYPPKAEFEPLYGFIRKHPEQNVRVRLAKRLFEGTVPQQVTYYSVAKPPMTCVFAADTDGIRFKIPRVDLWGIVKVAVSQERPRQPACSS